MERRAVDSSNIKDVGFDEETNTLELGFNNGGVYQYANVPKEIYEGLLEAESKGKFFWKHIRGEYEFEKEED